MVQDLDHYSHWAGDEGLEDTGVGRKNWKTWILQAIVSLLTIAFGIYLLVIYITKKKYEDDSPNKDSNGVLMWTGCKHPLARWALGEAIPMFILPIFFYCLATPFTRSIAKKRLNMVISTIGCCAIMWMISWYGLGCYWLYASHVPNNQQCPDSLWNSALTAVLLMIASLLLTCFYLVFAGKPSMAAF